MADLSGRKIGIDIRRVNCPPKHNIEIVVLFQNLNIDTHIDIQIDESVLFPKSKYRYI
jgi:hypothetical protein